MTKKQNIAVLYGGPSSEHEISLRSAASVISHLDKSRYQIYPIGIDKAGCCYYNPLEAILPCLANLPVKTPVASPLPGLLHHGKFALDVDVVFPVVHGPLLEDGALQGMLELADVAYVGSGVLSSAVCMDKDLSRKLVAPDEIQATPYLVISIHDTPTQKQTLMDQAIHEFGYPLFVKPCHLGSSVGIHKVKQACELPSAIEDAFRFDDTVLIEKAVDGLEVELAVLENSEAPTSPLVSVPGSLTVSHPDGFYSYQAKYIDSDFTTVEIPANLPESMQNALKQKAGKIFTRLKCQGMARVDFFVDVKAEAIYFNEVNTLPGFTSISMYPQLWEASGLAYDKLLDKLITLASLNHQRKQQKLKDYT